VSSEGGHRESTIPFGQSPDLDVYLVLPATLRPAGLRKIVNRHKNFPPSKLPFTHLDETGAFGSIWNEAPRTGKAGSFHARGRRFPRISNQRKSSV
jgi:flagellar biosynthesis GTPase FlhF